jgi:hypothetical protein
MADDTAALYAAAGAPRNPLAMVDEMAQTQGHLAQASMLNQQLAARQAIGPILMSAIDQDTGEVDWNKAFVSAARNPATAFMASELLNQGLQRKQTQLDIATKSLELESKKAGMLAESAASLLYLKDNVTKQDLARRLQEEISNKLITPEQAMGFYDRAPKNGKELNHFLMQTAFQFKAQESTMNKTLGTIQNTDFGGGVHQPTMTGIGGMQAVGPATAETIGPKGEKNLSVVPSPLDEAARVPPPGAPAGGGVGEAGEQSPASTPRGVTQLAPSPQQLDYYKGVGPMAKLGDQLTKEVTSSQRTMMLIEEAQKALKDFHTGPGMETRMELARVASALGLPEKYIQRLSGATGEKDALAAAQEFEKLAVQNAVQSMKEAYGSGQRYTNFEFQKFYENHPHLEMKPGAIDKIFKFMTKLSALTRHEQKAFTSEVTHGNFDANVFTQKWQDYLAKKGYVDWGGKVE